MTGTVPLVAVNRVLERFDDAGAEALMLRLIDDAATNPLLAVLALAAAAGVGAMHALGPGHGKLMIAGYLASSRGRPRDALALGGLVALMHTGSVLVLGAIFFSTATLPGDDRLETVLGVLTALAVIAVGVVVVTRQLRARRARRAVTVANSLPVGAAAGEVRAHGHAPHPHERVDGPGHVHDHDHELPPGVRPLSRAGVTALAASGGLLPSPAAFAVLVTAFTLGRSGYGLALIVAFSLGLAGTLSLIGLAVLFGRDRLGGHTHRHPALAAVSSMVPLLGGLAVLVGGLVLLATALVT